MSKWNNLRLGVRLIVGFLFFIILSSVVGFIGINAVSQVNKAGENVERALTLTQDILQARRSERNYVITLDGQYVEEVKGQVMMLRDMLKKIKADFNNSEVTNTCDKIDLAASEYETAFLNYVKSADANKDIEVQWRKIGDDFNAQIESMKQKVQKGDGIYLQANKLETAFEQMKVMAVYYMWKSSDKTWNDFTVVMKNTLAESQILELLTYSNPAQSASATAIYDYINRYIIAATPYHVNAIDQNIQSTVMIEAGRKIEGHSEKGNQYFGGAAALIVLAKNEADAARTLATFNIIAFIAVAIVVGLFMAIILMRGITGPVNKIKSAMQKIALGDVTEIVNIKSNDEIGQMAQSYSDMQAYLQGIAGVAERMADGDLSMNVAPKSERDALGNSFSRMLISLSHLVGQIRDSVNLLASASQQLNAASQEAGQASSQIAKSSAQVAEGAGDQAVSLTQATQGMQHLARAIDQIAAGSQEQAKSVEKNAHIVSKISSAITDATANANEADKGARLAAEYARKGTKIAEDTVIGMERIKKTMSKVSEKVNELGNRSKEIGKIVAAIDDIADQTNLLALNAAIEAARAGEQGRGFAVVADEVRKLAERASASTKDIADLIAHIQHDVNDTVEAMNSGTAEVEKGCMLANDAGKELVEIQQQADAVGKQVNKIAAATLELTALSSEMVKITDSISSIVDENSASTEEMAASSKQVEQSVEGVAGVAEENSAVSQEVSASSEQISAQVQQVVASAQSLSSMAVELEKAVAVFKTNGHSSVATLSKTENKQLKLTGDRN